MLLYIIIYIIYVCWYTLLYIYMLSTNRYYYILYTNIAVCLTALPHRLRWAPFIVSALPRVVSFGALVGLFWNVYIYYIYIIYIYIYII